MKRWLIEKWNALRGYRFFWVATPGSPAGGYLGFTRGTCPYPLLNDWSVKACNKAALCGCNERTDDIPKRWIARSILAVFVSALLGLAGYIWWTAPWFANAILLVLVSAFCSLVAVRLLLWAMDNI